MLTAHQALLSELDKAIAGLGQRKSTDSAIHQIRKELKRARAALRLMRNSIGALEYRRDNAVIRDVARPLTPLRDAKVLLDTLHRWDSDQGPKKNGAFTRDLRRVLLDRRRIAEGQLRSAELQRAVHQLREIRSRVAAFSDERLKQTPPGKGLKRAYRSGRKAFARVKERRTDERLHEWRKQAKYFANQLEIMVPFGPKRFAKSLKRAARLADQLGDDHDLALLIEQIYRYAKGANAPSQNGAVQELISRLSHRRKELQRRALRTGQRLYSDKPARYRP